MKLIAEIAWTHVSTRVRQTTVAVLGATCGVALTILLAAMMQGGTRQIISSLVDTMPHVTISDELRSAQYQPAEDSYGAAQVTSYLGLVPREYSSGEHRHRGRILRSAHPHVQSLLIQAAWRMSRSADAKTARSVARSLRSCSASSSPRMAKSASSEPGRWC